MEFVSKEQQKKMEFIPLPIKEVKQPTSNILKTSGAIAGGGAVALGGSYVGGKILEKAGKGIYGLTLPPVQQEAEAIQSYRAGTTNIKPRTAVDTMLDQPLLQGKGTIKETMNQFVRSPSSVVGEMGTRSQIGTQAELGANNIYKKTINPLFKQAEEKGIQLSFDDLINNARTAVNGSKKYSVTQKATILDDIADLAKQFQGTTTTLKNLDLEKQAIAGKMPSKYFGMAKIPQEAKAAQNYLASAFREGVHSTMKKEFGVDSAKLYREYANLKGVSGIGPKALTQAGRKGGFGGIASRVAEELLTPVSTTAGKLMYKGGKLLQYVPQKFVDVIKKTPQAIKNLPVKAIVANIIEQAPAGILAEQFGRSIKENTGKEGIRKNITSALEDLKAGGKVSRGNPIAYMVKGMDNATALALLEKVLLSK